MVRNRAQADREESRKNVCDVSGYTASVRELKRGKTAREDARPPNAFDWSLGFRQELAFGLEKGWNENRSTEKEFVYSLSNNDSAESLSENDHGKSCARETREQW